MDKKINKIDKEVKHGQKKKAVKDLAQLKKMDKVQDKKVDAYEKMKKGKC